MSNERTVKAMVHSLGAMAEVTIISEDGYNNVIALYNGRYCTAVYNPFVGCFYVDDKYGDVTDRYQKGGE